MKKIAVMFFLLASMIIHTSVGACVGKTLYIGITNAPSEILYAEMISVLVNERTGTAVKVVTFKDSKDMYAAMKKGEVGVLIEHADRALKFLNRPVEGNARSAYEAAKKEYRTGMNLVWLEPFGGSRYSAPVLSAETIGNLPALPKLINKLGGMITDETCAKLLKSMKSDEKPRKVARDFLKTRKLI